jgi:membrane-bound serine protease (ClpP class)
MFGAARAAFRSFGRYRLVVALLFLVILGGFAGSASGQPRPVRSVRWEGPIGPVTARYLVAQINAAETSGAGLIVIGLDTPGGLDTSMREIIKAIGRSTVPVAVWVGPSGARAASAGCVIGLAAHLLAMAPGTNIGAAHPVSIGGGGMDSTMSSKVMQDAEAYAAALARERGRNEEWARRAVTRSVSVTAREAVDLKVADFLASDPAEVVRLANGRTVQTPAGSVLLSLDPTRIESRGLDWRTQVMALLNDPNIAYILLLLGIYGLFFELSNPGALFPGIFGAISLILGLYSLSNLSVNYAGLLLLLAGLIMLLAEIKVPSHGILTIGGVLALTLGSLFLIDSPLPFFRVSLTLIIPAVLATAAFFLFLVGKGLTAQKRRVRSGQEALIGGRGIARTPIDPRGTVFIEGTHWSAVSDEPIASGEPVIVVHVEDLLLKVRRA